MAIGVALIGGGIWAKEEHLVSMTFVPCKTTTTNTTGLYGLQY